MAAPMNTTINSGSGAVALEEARDLSYDSLRDDVEAHSELVQTPDYIEWSAGNFTNEISDYSKMKVQRKIQSTN
jgi:hypothetical protein